MGIVASGAILDKAGANVSPVVSGAMLVRFASGAISTVCAVARENFVDSFTTLNDDLKHIISDTVTSLAAIPCITYDMSGFTSRIEAEDMINVNRDIALRGLSILRDKKVVDFINGT